MAFRLVKPPPEYPMDFQFELQSLRSFPEAVANELLNCRIGVHSVNVPFPEKTVKGPT
jgi:hypothetical protein